jgi:N-acetylglucosaminyl-diphospho-decaprenol L-rhamnosyltransferase
LSRVAVIIVNYRTDRLVLDCLRALRSDSAEHVTVVDNASGDGSIDRLRENVAANKWSDWVTLIALDHNGGFAAGNNAALRAILATPLPPDYVLLLNPDTVPRPEAVTALVEYLDRHPRVGTPQTSAFRFPTVRGEFEHGARFGPVSRLLADNRISMPIAREAHRADWVTGASMMIRRAAIEQIGLLDEGYFLYYEEVDYCRRAARAGWSCSFVPQSRVVHLVSKSTGLDDPLMPRRVPGYWFASRQRYYAKHHRTLDAWCASLAWSLGFATWRVRRWLTRQPDPDPPHLLSDFVRHSLLAPLLGSVTAA